MGSIGLPSKDSSDVYLTTATSAEIEVLQNANSVEWKGALALEPYLRREKHLASQDLTKDGGLTSWVLVWHPSSATERQVLCGCESINKRAVVSKNGKVEEAISHAIGSVFCLPSARGKGYAGRMMKELGEKLEHWQVDNGKKHLFSVLYSDIGKQFYAARGWQPFPSSHISLPASERPLPEGVQLLKSQDLADLCAADENLIRARLQKQGMNGRTTVSILPDSQTAAWHHAREGFVAKELYSKTPTIKGAKVGSVWAYWTRVWADPNGHDPNALHILRLVVEDEDLGADLSAATETGTEAIIAAAEGRIQLDGLDAGKIENTQSSIAKIFEVAQTEAARWDMKEVMLWNPTNLALAGAKQVKKDVLVEERDEESICSLRWYGEGTWQDVDWVENMKYAWC